MVFVPEFREPLEQNDLGAQGSGLVRGIAQGSSSGPVINKAVSGSVKECLSFQGSPLVPEHTAYAKLTTEIDQQPAARDRSCFPNRFSFHSG
jgi:hypothetical protein